jgi:biotin/methionine sulfoxide reductase
VAAARGIADGDVAALFNDRGCCLPAGLVTKDIPPGVLRLATGDRTDPVSDALDAHGNPTMLASNHPGFSQRRAPLNSLVQIVPRSDPAAPTAHAPPMFDGARRQTLEARHRP